jgi:hypothetical protein
MVVERTPQMVDDNIKVFLFLRRQQLKRQEGISKKTLYKPTKAVTIKRRCCFIELNITSLAFPKTRFCTNWANNTPRHQERLKHQEEGPPGDTS